MNVKKITTAAALTAALALGTAPAFAATEGSVGELKDATIKTETPTTGTTVSVETTVSQIDVQLPLAMTIAAPTAGGTTAVPSDGKYKIVNKSIFPIKVAKAESQAAEGWSLASNAFTTPGAPTATAGDLYLKLTPTGKSSWEVATTEFVPTDWTIAAATSAEGDNTDELQFALTGSNSKLAKTFTGATKAVTLTYTIEADSAAPATDAPTA